MKKLLSALAICTVAGYAMAQEVVSANIVGYQTISAAGQYATYGATFITVGDGNGEWKLGNMTANGMDPFADIIQFLDANDLMVISASTYIDEATAIDLGDAELQGWWDPGDLGGTSMDNETFAAGTGFLCNIGSGNPVEIIFSGEVVQSTISLDLSGMVYPLIGNPVPADLKLNDITADGMDPFTDIIQFLDPDDLTVYLAATYIDEATAIDLGDAGLQGWWDPGDLGGTSLDDADLYAAAVFLCNLSSGNPVTMVFPNPVD